MPFLCFDAMLASTSHLMVVRNLVARACSALPDSYSSAPSHESLPRADGGEASTAMSSRNGLVVGLARAEDVSREVDVLWFLLPHACLAPSVNSFFVVLENS